MEPARPEESAQADEAKRARRARRRSYLIVALGLVLIVLALGGIKFAQINKLMGFGAEMQAAGPPPEAVSSEIAKASQWESTLSAVGSVSGVKSVDVSNDAPGIVTRIAFDSGDSVKKGQVLVELDADQERAQLAAAAARKANAQRIAERSRELVDKGAIAREQLDIEETQLAAVTGEVAGLRAQIERKIIRAPFDGKLGIRSVDLGQYLPPGTKVASLESVEGTYVDFTLPQEQLGAVKVGMPVRVSIAGAKEPVTAAITAIDPTVDNSTRSFQLRASVEATDAPLRPGMFVDIDVVLPQQAEVVSLPATAVVHAAYGDSVFVIEPKPPGSPGTAALPDGRPVKVVRQQFVQLGRARGDFVSITKGLKAGQEVVSAGAFKLRNGSPVVVDNRVKPTASLDPRPENR